MFLFKLEKMELVSTPQSSKQLPWNVWSYRLIFPFANDLSFQKEFFGHFSEFALTYNISVLMIEQGIKILFKKFCVSCLAQNGYHLG